MKKEYEGFGWDLGRKEEKDRLRWALSQWRLFALRLWKDKTMADLPDMGQSDDGSAASFDWYLVLESETKELLQ